MKPEVHPLYPPSRIHCACGNVFETRSTRGSFNVEICANCHPFYTGKYKLVDTAGRVEKFRKKYEGTKGAAMADKVPMGAEAAAASDAADAAAAAKAKGDKGDKPAEAKAEPKAKKAKGPKAEA